jgi:hypothetical protein
MNNIRQQRAVGFAAVELAQRMLQELRQRRTSGENTSVTNDGASGPFDSVGLHAFGWRDAMDIIVRWRQVGEPNDQVLWVDRLTREEFERGFGSHTPMYSGQTKCVRYFMNCARGLKLFGEIICKNGYVIDAQNRHITMTDAQLEAISKVCALLVAIFLASLTPTVTAM